MEILDKKYKVELDSIKGAIQSSDLLAQYLDSEEEEDYHALRIGFEPQIDGIFQRVASDNPLQLVNFERELLDPDFEGLYLSKILGFSVLRGEIDKNYKYKKPQDHFREILLAISNSLNFELIKLRIGQTVQVGFALSSDIWITNLISKIPNNRVRYFLEAQKLDKYYDVDERRRSYLKYRKQFAHANFESADFPENVSELKLYFTKLKQFLFYRIKINADNKSLLPKLKEFLTNKTFRGHLEFTEMLALFTNFYNSETEKVWLGAVFNEVRQTDSNFPDDYFRFLEEMLLEGLDIDKKADQNVLDVLDISINDDLNQYYHLMDIIHSKGYIHDDSIEAVRSFYEKHEGMSIINECLRQTLLTYFTMLITNLEPESYHDYFEMNKIFSVYIQIFNNQHFNQSVKKLSLSYVAKLIKRYTDKRGKDYQDIKKFVIHTFLDLGFLKEKELVELFKTRRKKRVT
jgi:hypothetical protein